MGFYSIYRILKDMLRTIFGNKFLKFLFIFLLITIIYFLFCNSFVHASSDIVLPVSKPDGTSVDVTLPSFISNNDYNFYFAAYWNNDNKMGYVLYVSDGIIYYDSSTGYLSVPVGAKFYRLSGSSSGSSNGSYIQSNINTNVNLNSSMTTATTGSWNQGQLKDDVYYNNSVPVSPVYYCNTNILYKNTTNVYREQNYSSIILPSIINSIDAIDDLSFDVLRINAGSYSQVDLYLLCYDDNYQSIESLNNLYPVNTFKLNQLSRYFMRDRTSDFENGAIYWVPRDELGFNWAIGNTYSFRFAIRVPIENDFSDWTYEYLTPKISYTISSGVSQDKVDDLNAETQQKLENQQHEQTINSINSIDSFLRDDSLDDSNIDLPTDSTSDITSYGLENIFLLIYNGFTSGNPQNIVLPVPYTNQQIVIDPHYLENVLSDHSFDLITYYIRVFYWYFISRFIVKDVMDKIQKMKSGDVENVEETNIKGEML